MNNIKEKILVILEFCAYFFATIIVLSSLGVWLPFASEKALKDKISLQTWRDLPWNLITYSVAIVMVSFIDRLRYLFKNTNKFKRNEREFLFLLFVLILGGYLIYTSLVNSRFDRLKESIMEALYFTILAWIFWIYVKLRNPSYDNYSTLGGVIA